MHGLDYRNGKSKNAPTLAYRMMTVDEAKALTGSHATVVDQHGNLRTVKVNGAVKTWKRDPNRVEIPLKYGLYETFRDVAIDDVMTHLVVVEEGGAS